MNTKTQYPSIARTPRTTAQRFAVIGLVALAAMAAPAFAYDVTLLNLQPVDAPSWDGVPYDPTDASANVLMEPLQFSGWTGPADVRTNLDFEVKNEEEDWLRLDELEIQWIGSGEPNLWITGDDLFAVDPSLYTWELTGAAEARRTVIANGGFGVSGLVLQQKLDEVQPEPFGRFLDVEAYLPPGGKTSYVAAGYIKFYIGSPPEDPADPYEVDYQGALVRYDAAGRMVTAAWMGGDRLTHVVEVGEGAFLTLGESGVPTGDGGWKDTVTLSKVLLYEIDYGGDLIYTNSIRSDTDFGTNGTVHVFFGEAGCGRVATKGLTVLDTDEGTRYMLAGSSRCGGQERAVLALLNTDGSLDPNFGDGGKLILAGPGGGKVRPVGLAARGGAGADTYEAWLAAQTGPDTCFGYPWAGCQFGLTRLTLEGQDEAFGWVENTFPETANAYPRALVVDAEGRPILGGQSVSEFGSTYAALSRYTTSGSLDAAFGDNGLKATMIGGHEVNVYDLNLSADGTILAAVAFRHPVGADLDLSFGVATFAQNGDLGWYHDTIAEGSRWQHAIPGEDFNYGSLLEAGIQAVPEALAEDDTGAIVVVGAAMSQLLPESPGVGPMSMAVARYLPFGEPHSRRWVAPDKTLSFKVPEDRNFAGPGPEQVWIRLDFEGETANDFEILRDVEVVTANAVNSHGAPGGYLFPVPQSELADDDAIWVRAHPLMHHHRHSASNRFAYDLRVNRWDGVEWTRQKDGVPDLSVNENYIGFGLDVQAMAEGQVIACRRSAPDNVPGEIPGTPSNFVQIQHAWSGNKTEMEFVSYIHLKQDSIPEKVCPLICPDEDEPCDLETEGVDPDGRLLPNPVSVSARDVIGQIGNSGSSSAPHLHVHLNTAAGGGEGDPLQGNVPILFQDAVLGNPFDAVGDQIEPTEWYPIHNLALPHDYLARPSN